jgi:hypothetical protein
MANDGKVDEAQVQQEVLRQRLVEAQKGRLEAELAAQLHRQHPKPKRQKKSPKHRRRQRRLARQP